MHPQPTPLRYSKLIVLFPLAGLVSECTCQVASHDDEAGWQRHAGEGRRYVGSGQHFGAQSHIVYAGRSEQHAATQPGLTAAQGEGTAAATAAAQPQCQHQLLHCNCNGHRISSCSCNSGLRNRAATAAAVERQHRSLLAGGAAVVGGPVKWQ